MSASSPDQKNMPNIELFGGLDGLRKVLIEFYERIFKDPMISYLFAAQNKALLVERELEWTAKALGYPIEYKGKGIARAHQAHAIRRGHFFRRNQLLLETLQSQALPKECIDWWMEHSAAMERAILGRAQGGKACEETANGEGEQLELSTGHIVHPTTHNLNQDKQVNTHTSTNASAVWHSLSPVDGVTNES